MTRINVIDPSELNDKMLLAEYRELPRISKLARLPKPREQFPTEYTLGKGHVTFFYDKGAWLKNRFENEIVPEMQRRGFVTNYIKYREHPEGLNNTWTVTEEAMKINRERIQERINDKATD